MKILIIIFVLFFTMHTPAQAQELSPAARAALTTQLQILLTQVATLQAQLDELQAAKVTTYTQDDLYPTDFYKGAYEAAYTVEGSELTPVITAGVRAGDKALFETFVNLVGESFSKRYISEFRIFNDEDNELGAFVQEKRDSSWILAVNRFDEDLGVTHTSDQVTEILLHEYAHIIFFEDTQVANDFKDTYWENTLMRSHAERISDITNADERFDAYNSFYEQHEEMFVSEYAASASEEDLVESFTSFVRTDRPSSNPLRDDKVLFFYKYSSMVKLRSQLRDSNVLTLQ